MTEFTLERKPTEDDTPILMGSSRMVMMTPPINEDYWSYRVMLTETQAIIGFPKFGTIGIGFMVEEDWNTNLPYSVPTERIYNHIKHNKGDKAITKAMVMAAIRLVQEAAAQDRTQ